MNQQLAHQVIGFIFLYVFRGEQTNKQTFHQRNPEPTPIQS